MRFGGGPGTASVPTDSAGLPLTLAVAHTRDTGVRSTPADLDCDSDAARLQLYHGRRDWQNCNLALGPGRGRPARTRARVRDYQTGLGWKARILSGRLPRLTGTDSECRAESRIQ